MELIYRSEKSDAQVMLIRGSGDERDRAEQELLDAGVPLPLMHRKLWVANQPRWETLFLLVRDANGNPIAGAAIEEVRTRALPGHIVLRLRRFGHGLPDEACRAILHAAAILAKRGKRVLRLQVNIFSKDRCGSIGEMMKELGFRPVSSPSSYRHTLVVDLRPSEEEIFAKFSASTRNKIRKTGKKSLSSEVITDPAYADRLLELQEEALRRTGGHTSNEDWAGILSMSREHPNLSTVYGLFLGEDRAPENLVACAWVSRHGDHAEYRASGVTRRDDLKAPLNYLLMWEMIRWSKAHALWFDMGGVTLSEGDDPLEGISDFKRSFTREVAEVGAEWVMEPSPVRARLASVITAGMDRARHLMKRYSERPKELASAASDS